MKSPAKAKWEAIPSKKQVGSKARQAVLSVREFEDALRDLFLAAQEGVTFNDTTLNRLAVFKEKVSGLLVCGGRVRSKSQHQSYHMRPGYPHFSLKKPTQQTTRK